MPEVSLQSFIHTQWILSTCESWLENLEKCCSSFESNHIGPSLRKCFWKVQPILVCSFLVFSRLFQGGILSMQRHGSMKATSSIQLLEKKKMVLIPSSFTEPWCTRVNESLRFPWHTKYKSIVWALENTVVQLSSSTALLWIYLLHSRSLVLKPLSLLNTLKQLQNLTNCFKSSNQNSIVSICSKKDSVLTKLLLTANRTAIHSPPSAQSTVLVHVQVN